MNTITKFVAAGAGAVVLVAGGGAAYATATATTAPKITAERAIEIAHQQVPGAWVKEVSYDGRGSRPDVWEVELVTGNVDRHLDVDTATGKVLSQRAGHKGDDRRDDHRKGDDRKDDHRGGDDD